MKKTAAIVLLPLCILLCGCQSAQMEAEQRLRIQLHQDEQACSRYGFQPYTTAWAGCMQQLDLSRRQKRIADCSVASATNDLITYSRLRCDKP